MLKPLPLKSIFHSKVPFSAWVYDISTFISLKPLFIINFSNYRLFLKIHKVLCCQNCILWPIFDKVLMLLKQRQIANLDLDFLTYIIMELFTSWFVKLTLFFRANIFSIGIGSLLIFSVIRKDFIPYQTMHFIVSSFTLIVVEGRFHEINIVILIYSVIWQQRDTFYVIYYWWNCWDCRNSVFLLIL